MILTSTPEQIAQARQKDREEILHAITEGPAAPYIQSAAQTLTAMQQEGSRPVGENTNGGLQPLAVKLLNNLEDFRRGNPCDLIPMLATQASILDALFNRALQNAGLEDKERFSVHKANVALQAQRQCKTLVEFLIKINSD